MDKQTHSSVDTVVLGDYTIRTKYAFIHLPNRQTVINAINPHSWVTAQADEEFRQALLNSEGLIPDGLGIVLACKYVNNIKIRKMAGADLHLNVLEQLNRTGGSVFYLGSSTDTLTKIAQRIHTEYTHIRVATFSPPFRDQFSVAETETMIKVVNDFAPDVLFVGMTAPKQEKWIATNRHLLNARFISGIGAVFEFYGGTTSRPPQWMISLGLEWLGRLLKEPRRMWRRNFISTPKFLFNILLLTFKRNKKEKL